MRLPVAPTLLSYPNGPMAPACPTCNELMIFKRSESWTMMYGHRLGRYAL